MLSLQAAFPSCVCAHAVSTGYISVVQRPGRLELVVTLDANPVLLRFGSEPNSDAVPRFREYVDSHLHLEINGEPVLPKWENPSASPQGFAALFKEARDAEADLAQQTDRPLYKHLAATCSLKGAPWKIAVSARFSDWLGENHTFFVKMTEGDHLQTAVIDAAHPKADFYLQGRGWMLGQSVQFTRLGIRHIFLGYDHLLFLLALLIIGGSWLTLIKVVTAFTAAHSLTLALAVLGWVTVLPRVAESAIALSIVYVGLQNLFVSSPSYRWRLAFFFGLVHGFGFAGILKELGLPSRGLAGSLFSFNVGVEIGQLAVVVCLLPLVKWLSTTRFRLLVIRIISVGVVLMGTAWFLERSLGSVISSGR